MTSAGTLHDRRRDNRLQVMRRNRGQFLHARHKGQRPDGVEVPASSASPTPGESISTTTAVAALNSTVGLNATTTTAILESTTSELMVTSETGAVDATTCPPAVTVTVTETSMSISTMVGGGETQTSDESASIVTTPTEPTDPALTTDASASIVTTLSENPALSTADPALSTVVDETPTLTAPADGSPPFTFIPDTSPSSTPAVTNIAEAEQPALEQPTPLEDGDVTTQIFTQTISSPAATLVLESTVRRGRNRGKVVTITEESPESVGVETVTLVVTQSERIELVTSESGVATEPTAIVVDGIASEVQSATTETTVATETANAGETSVAVTDGNAASETSTSCTDSGVILTSLITVDAPAATASAAPEIPDANKNVISMISVITLTKSADPFVTTTNIDGVPALITATPEPELILSTIVLGPGGATGTGTAAPVETGGGSGGGNGSGKGKGKGRKNKGGGKGNGRGNGNDSTGKKDGNGVEVGRNQDISGGRGQDIGRGIAGGDYD